jgi:hypothetical protein
MSRSLVHIRVSEKNNFLHEHEIFEMMKSRQLYQMQFDLKRKLEKRIRAIELAEKVHISTFQSKKNVFLNKMREKIRQKSDLDLKLLHTFSSCISSALVTSCS